MATQIGPFFVGEVGSVVLSHTHERTRAPQLSSLQNRLLEALRKGDENFGEELADVVIRVADLAGGSNVDLEGEIAKKMAKTRTVRGCTVRRFNPPSQLTNEFPLPKPKDLACNTLDTEP